MLFRRRQQFDEVSCSSAVAHFEDGGCNDANYIKCIQFKFLNEMERKIPTILELLVREDLPKETFILLGIALHWERGGPLLILDTFWKVKFSQYKWVFGGNLTIIDILNYITNDLKLLSKLSFSLSFTERKTTSFEKKKIAQKACRGSGEE